MANLMTNLMSFLNFVLSLTTGQVETDIDGQRRKVEALICAAWPHTKSYAFSDRMVFKNNKYYRGPSMTRWCWEPSNTIPENFTFWLWVSPSKDMVLKSITINHNYGFSVSVFATYQNMNNTRSVHMKQLWINLR